MLLRGENARDMQLADLFCLEFKEEGPTECIALIAVLRQGKMNQVGRIEYGGVLRHFDVEQCAFGSLAMLLFWRWDISDEAVPSFKSNSDWYDIFLQITDPSKPTSGISYKTQWYVALFSYV